MTQVIVAMQSMMATKAREIILVCKFQVIEIAVVIKTTEFTQSIQVIEGKQKVKATQFTCYPVHWDY